MFLWIAEQYLHNHLNICKHFFRTLLHFWAYTVGSSSQGKDTRTGKHGTLRWDVNHGMQPPTLNPHLLNASGNVVMDRLVCLLSPLPAGEQAEYTRASGSLSDCEAHMVYCYRQCVYCSCDCTNLFCYLCSAIWESSGSLIQEKWSFWERIGWLHRGNWRQLFSLWKDVGLHYGKPHF